MLELLESEAPSKSRRTCKTCKCCKGCKGCHASVVGEQHSSWCLRWKSWLYTLRPPHGLTGSWRQSTRASDSTWTWTWTDVPRLVRVVCSVTRSRLAIDDEKLHVVVACIHMHLHPRSTATTDNNNNNGNHVVAASAIDNSLRMSTKQRQAMLQADTAAHSAICQPRTRAPSLIQHSSSRSSSASFTAVSRINDNAHADLRKPHQPALPRSYVLQ